MKDKKIGEIELTCHVDGMYLCTSHTQGATSHEGKTTNAMAYDQRNEEKKTNQTLLLTTMLTIIKRVY